MPSFLSRPKRMSNHRARSGEFSAQKLKDLQDAHDADSCSSQQPPKPRSSRSPARSYSAPYAQRSPAALIVDYRGGGSGGSSSRGGGACARPADHEAPHHQQEQEHRRMVSLSCSWPGGEGPLLERNADWERQLQDMSRRISTSSTSSTSSASTSGGGGGKGAEEPVGTAPVAVDANVNFALAAAPNKRQRQMAFSKKRVSSGPIDIPPSPRMTTASSVTAARGFHGALAMADGGESDGRGARAATDAGEWYPCWSATRPDDKKCGEGGGPPEHILIWERSVQQHQDSSSSAREGGGDCGGGGTRVSEGGASRGMVVEEEDDSEAEDDELLQRRPERRMSSDQGSGSVMLFEMDM